MEMWLKVFCFAVFMAVHTEAQETTNNNNEDETTDIYDPEIIAPNVQNKTVEDLVNAQTDAIRKIISAQKNAIENPIFHPSVRDRPVPNNLNIKTNQHHYPQNHHDDDNESIDEIKAKCEYYFKLHQHRHQDRNNHNDDQQERYKDIGGGEDDPTVDESKIEEFSTDIPEIFEDSQKLADLQDSQNIDQPQKLEDHKKSQNSHITEDTQKDPQNIDHPQNNGDLRKPQKTNIHINNYDTQNLPYPDREFFTLNPDKSRPKPNSKGPVPQSTPVFVNNGYYQYVPNDYQSLNPYGQSGYPPIGAHLQPPYASNPVDFQPLKSDMKYVKLSPLALQNNLVSDGKYVYYWYKPIPNYQIYLPAPNAPINPEKNDDAHAEASNESLTKSGLPTTTEKSITTTTTTTTTEATTTEAQPSYDVTYTENKPKTDHYQLKFVYPFYPSRELVTSAPWEIDPYAYYPKQLQPEYMNVKVPYTPTFQMIKTLKVPNNIEGGNIEVSTQNA